MPDRCCEMKKKLNLNLNSIQESVKKNFNKKLNAIYRIETCIFSTKFDELFNE